jgi:hypothetical protein
MDRPCFPAPPADTPAPSYSAGLEFAVGLLLRSMEPAHKLILARRMLDVFRFVEGQALQELSGAKVER